MIIDDHSVTQETLHAWHNNPDLKCGLVSCLDLPIRSPDGRPFGTICLLDDKENTFSPELLMLMERMRDLIEGDLRLRKENRLQRLFANQSLLRRVLDNIPMAVACATCAPDPKTLYLNEQFTRTFGYTQSDLPTMDGWFALLMKRRGNGSRVPTRRCMSLRRPDATLCV